MLKIHKLNAVAYRKIFGMLFLGLVVSCVVFVGTISAQDDTPSIPKSPNQEMQQTPVPQTPERSTPVLTISPLGPQKIGRVILTTATLKHDQGVPQTNKPLLIFVDGQQIRRDRTDDNGVSSISLGSDIPLGEHQLQVQFIGTAAYVGVNATTSFLVIPLQLIMETVPPLAGIPISVNGQSLTTDAKGLAVVDIGTAGPVDLEVLQKPNTNVDENTRVSFVRWSDEGFQPKRTLNITGDDHIQIGFSVSHPVVHSFVDLSGNSIDYSKVTTMLVRTSTGELVTFSDNQPRWITSTQIARRRLGLEATNVLYSVESVMIDGTNVVNRYQQRYLAQVNTPWQIQLLLYSAIVNANDALFGFSVGHGITLEYPDGHTQDFSFSPNKDIHLDTLARGTYRIKVNGVQNLTGWTPVALSRSQTVQLQVFSSVDVAAITALGIVIALTMLFYGRPFLMKLPLLAYRGRRRRAQSMLGAPMGETGSFNLTFFHSSVVANAAGSGSTSKKGITTSQANRRRTGNVLQISSNEATHGKPAVTNIVLQRLICVAHGRTKRRQLLVDLILRWHTQMLRQSRGQPITRDEDGMSQARPASGVFTDICAIYAELPTSRRQHYRPEQFDFRHKNAQCTNCEGYGRLPGRDAHEDFIVCPVCRGTGYKSAILKVKLQGKNIAEVLNMTLSEGLVIFADYPTVADKLHSLQQLGFGDVVLREPGLILSTKGIINIQELREYIGHNLYVFNAPLGAMSSIDAARQVTTLAKILDQDSTIRIVEDRTTTKVITNPVVMLRLGRNRRKVNSEANDSLQGNTPRLGTDMAL